MVKSLTDKNFVEETKDGVVLVDFWATWCGPCRMQGPVIDQLDEERGDKVTFTKVDVDENPETARAFGIMSIPTLLIKKDGEVVNKVVGYHAKEQLEELLAQYLYNHIFNGVMKQGESLFYHSFLFSKFFKKKC